LHKILVVAAEQGLLDEAITKKGAVARLDVLRRWAIFNGRLREARYLTYFRVDLTNNVFDDIASLEELLQAFDGKSLQIAGEAQTHLDIARCLLKLEGQDWNIRAQDHIRKAEGLFANIGHTFGLLDLMDMQVTQRKDSTKLEDLLNWKIECSNAYLGKSCYQQGIRCLNFAIPVNHSMGEALQKTQSMIERVQQEITRIGGVLLEQALFVSGVSQALVRAPEYGYARKALEDYMDRLPTEIGPKILSLLYTCLRGAYSNLGDTQRALLFAEEALIASLESTSHEDKSDASFALAMTRLDQAHKYRRKEMALVWLSNASNLLRSWSEVDLVMDYQHGALEKYAWLAWIEIEISHILKDEQALERSDDWFKLACELRDRCNISSEKVFEIELLRAVRSQDFDLANEVASRRVRSLRDCAATTPFGLAQAITAASSTSYQCYTFRLQQAMRQSDGDFASILPDLGNAIKLAGEAYDLYSRDGGSEMIIVSLNYLYELLNRLPVDSRSDLVKRWLAEAEKIDDFCDAVRRSVAMTFGIQSLNEKRGIFSQKTYRKLYDNTVQACMELEDPSSAWIWMQKGKARSLSDVSGVRALIPESLLRAIAADGEAHHLFEQERCSTETAVKAGPLEYLEARRKAESHRGRMKKHPLLAQVLEIREGAFTVSFERSELIEAIEICGRSYQTIKYVDWYIPHNPASNTKVTMLLRQLDGETSVKVLEITVGQVEAWLKRIFEYPEEALPPLRRGNARRRLHELAPLVQDLLQLTKEEDLLILSPSGLLNRIPIHALPVGNRTLIERNPVIFSSSAAIFRQCHMKALAQVSSRTTHSQRASFLAVYESPGTEGEQERGRIYEHADLVANKYFPFEVHKGNSVTKTYFRDAASTSQWLHYHGHALFDKIDVLRSCLILSGGLEEAGKGDQDLSNTPVLPSDTKNLTVADSFKLEMYENVPHVTVIACDSGVEDIAPGDEPLGVISALLYAGATSALGALWPVDSQTARKFSELFYADLHNQIQTNADPSAPQVLDLAQALRRTVCEMMRKENTETKSPIHWAAYVLHGCWFRAFRQQQRH
jgi:CHAT domain-containing protein/tetratricopeptide (TPR) repeat protein